MTAAVIPHLVPIEEFDPDRLKLAQDKITRTSVWLMRNEPFYSALFMRLKRTPFKGTMGVDFDHLYYDPDFVMERTDAELRFICMHEILHVVFKHWGPGRRGSYSHIHWNHAADYVINYIIVEAGKEKANSTGNHDPSYAMPKDGLYEEAYGGMTTEEVAALMLLKQPPKPKSDGDGKGKGKSKGKGGQGDDQEQGEQPSEGQPEGTGEWGEVFEAKAQGGDLTKQQIDDMEAELARAVVQAEQVAKSRGDMPAALKMAIDELREPTPEWQERLREMLIDTIPKDYSFAKPNRMFMDAEIVMPSVEKYGLGHVCFMVDNSGSVSQREMEQFAADCKFIFDEMAPECITVINFDTRADEPVTYDNGDDFKLERTRGGGTRFKAAFDKATECGLDDDIDIAIFLTDGGDNTYPNEPPPYPVIWGTTGAFYGGDPEFGEILALKFQHGQDWG